MAVVTSEGNKPKGEDDVPTRIQDARLRGANLTSKCEDTVMETSNGPSTACCRKSSYPTLLQGVAGSRRVWGGNSGAIGMNNGPELDAESTSSEIPGD